MYIYTYTTYYCFFCSTYNLKPDPRVSLRLTRPTSCSVMCGAEIDGFCFEMTTPCSNACFSDRCTVKLETIGQPGLWHGS